MIKNFKVMQLVLYVDKKSGNRVTVGLYTN